MRITLTGCLVLFSSLLFGQSFEVRASAAEIPVGEPFEISFVLTGGEADQTSFPDFFGLEVLRGPVTEAELVNVNGQLQTRTVYKMDVVGTRPGKVLIKAATATVGQRVLATSPVELSIIRQQEELTKEDIRMRKALERSLGRNMFFEATTDAREVYVGQPITVSYDLWIDAQMSSQVGSISRENTPQFPGFSAVSVPTRSERSLQVRRGIRFLRTKISQYRLIPQTPGTYQLDTLIVGMTVAIPRANRRPQNDLEVFQRQFQPNFREYRYRLLSQTPTLRVLSLPSQGRPIDFSGLVGDPDLEIQLPESTYSTGEEVHVILTIRGDMDMSLFSPPRLELPPGIEGYPPMVTPSANGNQLRVDYSLVPREPGTFELQLPEIQIFNPTRRRYEAIGNREWTMVVTGESLATLPEHDSLTTTGQLRFDATLLPRPEASPLVAEISHAFWMLLLAPWLLLGLVYVFVRINRIRYQDPDFLRRQRLEKALIAAFSEAQSHLKKGDRSSVNSALHEAIWLVLADRFSLQREAQTDACLRSALGDSGWSERLQKEVWERLDLVRAGAFEGYSEDADKQVESIRKWLHTLPATENQRDATRLPVRYALNTTLLLMLGWTAVSAQSLWEQADKAVIQREYAMADSLYGRLYASGVASEVMFHNWSVAAWEGGNAGRAVWACEKGLRYSPGHDHLLNNLTFLRRQVRSDILPRPDLPFDKQWRMLVAGVGNIGWSWLALGLSLVLAGFIALGWWRAGFRRLRGPVVLWGTILLSFSLGLRAASDPAQPNGEGIVIHRTILREAPEGRQELISLAPGVKVYLGDQVSGWQEVIIQDPESGELRGFVNRGSVAAL